jgi:hypothetical protein
MLNTIQAVQAIASAVITTGSAASVQSSLSEDTLSEAAPRKGLHPSLTNSDGILKRFAWDAEKHFGISLEGKTADQIKAAVKAIKVERGGGETTSRDSEAKTAANTLAAKKYADVDTIFEDLKDLVNMVVKGSQPSLLVTGSPGTGKTYSINNVVKQHLGSEGSK